MAPTRVLSGPGLGPWARPGFYDILRAGPGAGLKLAGPGPGLVGNHFAAWAWAYYFPGPQGRAYRESHSYFNIMIK